MPINVSAGTPVNFQEQAEELKRRQNLVDALTAGVMRPKQNASAYTALGDVLASAILGRKQKALSEERRAYSDEYNAGMKAAMEGYLRQRDGAPAKTLPTEADVQNLMQNDQPLPPEAPAVAADPRRAAIEAVTSGFGPLQAIGMQDLQKLGQGGLSIKDVLAHASPAAQEAMIRSGNIQDFRGKRDLKTVGDVVYDPDSRQMVRLEGPAPEQTSINGDLYQRSPSTGELKKLDNAPNIRLAVNASPVIMGQKEGLKHYFANAADQVKVMGQVADNSQQLLNTLGTLRELQAKGIHSGMTSDLAASTAALAKSLGIQITDPAKLANTQTYNALLTEMWQRSISQFGGNRGVTKEEAQDIKNLLPLASKDPMAQQQLFTLMESKAKRDIARYQGANKSFAQAAAADDPNLFQIPDDMEQTYIPDAGNAPNPSVGLSKPSVSNW